jgi:hypothetical protein
MIDAIMALRAFPEQSQHRSHKATESQYIWYHAVQGLTYKIPRPIRAIKLIFIENFKLRFQNTRVGNTARNRSVAELTATLDEPGLDTAGSTLKGQSGY